MKTDWDYSGMASSYLHRPGYAPEAIAFLLQYTMLPVGSWVCDAGAGTGALSAPLCSKGMRVVGIEPNREMLFFGRRQTVGRENMYWVEAMGEATGLASGTFAMVSFGSSFNVMHRPEILQECRRILKPQGWIACLWNHRDVSDPLQHQVEDLIHTYLPGYQPGIRRSSLFCDLQEGGFFEKVHWKEFAFLARLAKNDWLEAWNSHATLKRQAGSLFPIILAAIQALVEKQPQTILEIPYRTSVWLAQTTKRNDTV